MVTLLSARETGYKIQIQHAVDEVCTLSIRNLLYHMYTQGDYAPKPADIRNVTLTRANLEMAERMAENAHDSWAKKKKLELESLGQLLILKHLITGIRSSFYLEKDRYLQRNLLLIS